MQRQEGFTLIEMMVTLAILGTLASAAIPFLQHNQTRQKERELSEALREIRTAIDRYAHLSDEGRIEKTIEASSFPTSLNQLAEGVVDKTSANGTKIYLLRRVPRDPFCDCAGRPNADTWRIRSSTQAPGENGGGRDVWDISSGNTALGLNGVPYAEW